MSPFVFTTCATTSFTCIVPMSGPASFTFFSSFNFDAALLASAATILSASSSDARILSAYALCLISPAAFKICTRRFGFCQPVSRAFVESSRDSGAPVLRALSVSSAASAHSETSPSFFAAMSSNNW